MMKRQTAILTMLLAGVMIMLAGCQEPFNAKSSSGLRIKISSMSNGLSTKTVYSDSLFQKNGSRWERIDWKAGDQVRIFSEDVSLVASAVGRNGSAYIYAEGDSLNHYDYKISGNGTPRESDRVLSDASLKDDGDGVGLVWVNDPTATATVYGIYPYGNSIMSTSTQKLRGFYDMTIVAPDLSWSTKTTTTGTMKTGKPTDSYMQSAYMVAAPTKFTIKTDEETGESIPTVNLEFYPIFNAFEFQLNGEGTSTVTVNSLTLSSTSSDLTGDYAFDYRNRNDAQTTYWSNSGTNKGPLVGGVDLNSGDAAARSKSVTVNFPSGTVISATDTVRFTVLTLPPADSHPLTDLTITVNYGNNKTKSLRLNENATSTSYGTPIEFPAFHKARIKGLAMKGDVWQLQIETSVNEWTIVEKTTTFSEQVGCENTQVSGAIENTSAYTSAHEGKENNYLDNLNELDSEGNVITTSNPNYYSRYYQVRRLDMTSTEVDPSQPEAGPKPHFVVKFKPFAPYGGYWQLIPEFIGTGSSDKFDIRIWDGFSYAYTSSPSGQIMNTEVELHIYPKNYSPDDENVYAMIFKSYFSSSISFDPSISADSEFQDVHGDGRYSYWRFTLSK